MKTGLKNFNIKFNSVNNTLKRVLSPQQFLLSKVAMLLYGFDTNIVSESFAILARNKAFSRGIFNYTNKENQVFVEAFPYGEIKTDSYESSYEKSDNFNTGGNPLKKSWEDSSQRNSSTLNIKKM